MNYMGGKFRQSKAILAELSKRHSKGSTYVEPFCGAMGSAERLVPYFGNGTLSDASQPVVTMWRAALDGWVPPFVSFERYTELKQRKFDPDGTDPLVAWAGHAASFRGAWYTTYARLERGNNDSGHEHQERQRRTLARKCAAIRGKVTVDCLDYRAAIARVPDGAVVYLDPPYADRTKPHHASVGFDSDEFWMHARALAKRAYVYASEFTWPDDWEVLHDWGDTVVRGGGVASDVVREVLVRWTDKDALRA